MLPDIKEVILLLYSVLVRPNVGNTVSSSGLHTIKETDGNTGENPKRGH